MPSPFNPDTASFLAILKRSYVCAFSDWTTRATRREYWLGYLGALLLFTIQCVVLTLINTLLIDDYDNHYLFWAAVFFPIAVLIWLPVRCLQVRRLHDIGCSGWWVLAPVILAPIPGIALLALAGEIILGCIDSQPGKNAWGISPKNRNGLPPVPSVVDVLPTVRMKRTKPVSPASALPKA